MNPFAFTIRKLASVTRRCECGHARTLHGCRNSRRGFSLLEVLLALALSVVVLGAITMAIRVHLITLQKQQTEIERLQVARSVIFMVTNDLRAALQYKPADVSGVTNLQIAQTSIAGAFGGADLGALMESGSLDGMDLDGGSLADLASGGGAGSETPPTDSGSTTGSQSGAQPAGAGSGEITTAGAALAGAGEGQQNSAPPGGGVTENNQNLAQSSQPANRPGLYGNASELSLDISRLPRLDEYSSTAISLGMTTDDPTDIKTITYFVSETASAGSGNQVVSILEDSQTGGLYRRELERSIASYAIDYGSSLDIDRATTLISPVIAEIAFRYFDGSEWVTEWDSDESGGFPNAIEVTVVIDMRRADSNNRSQYEYSGYDSDHMFLYRSVVHLPIAEPEPEDPAAAPSSSAPAGGEQAPTTGSSISGQDSGR